MKSGRAALYAVLCCLANSTALFCQQATATPQSVLFGSLELMGYSNVAGVTLSGSAQSTAGAIDDTGTFTANCSVGGISQLNLQLSSSSRVESRQMASSLPAGSWTDSQGVSHAMPSHNLFAPASWLCPGIALADILAASNVSIQFIGNELKSGTTLAHFSVALIPPNNGPQYQLLEHLSRIDLFLDPQSSLPIVLDFTLHPDVDSSTDIPIEVVFGNYAQVNGSYVPFTIQRYINSSLALSLQVQAVTPTSGTSAN